MTQYLLSVHLVDGTEPPPAEEMEKMYSSVNDFNGTVQAAGERCCEMATSSGLR